MCTDGTTQFTLEKAVKCLFFIITYSLCKAFNGNTTSVIVSDLKVLVASDGSTRLVRKQVANLLVVDLGVTDPDGDSLIKLVAGQGVKLGDGTGHHTAILEDSRAARHRVSLTRAGLSVGHDSAIVALDDRLHDLAGTYFVSFILASVMENLLKVEFPNVSLVVDDAEFLVLILLQGDGARVLVNLDVGTCEVCGRPRTNNNLHGLFR